jgi:hypothetical protein
MVESEEYIAYVNFLCMQNMLDNKNNKGNIHIYINTYSMGVSIILLSLMD